MHFTLEHLISFLAAFIFMGILAPSIVNWATSKHEESAKKRDASLSSALKERDDARDKLEKQWHENVLQHFKDQENKLTEYCNGNAEAHDDIWSRLNNHGHAINCKNKECLGVEIGKVIITEGAGPFRRRAAD
jgi:hypothetical protein